MDEPVVGEGTSTPRLITQPVIKIGEVFTTSLAVKNKFHRQFIIQASGENIPKLHKTWEKS